ncbi:MAG: hypothetical protein JRI84_09130 [Deltaproteobacteria bacterium]|nr:hypothetical protein [Deltaproteobacteria bacterium]
MSSVKRMSISNTTCFMHIPQGLDGIVGLKDPTGLVGPGDHDPVPVKVEQLDHGAPAIAEDEQGP